MARRRTHGQGGPGENVPAWLVSTSDTGTATSSWDYSQGSAFRAGGPDLLIVQADTLAGWRKAGLPADELTATVQRFNAFARSGVDEDYHRGKVPTIATTATRQHKPNPNLGEVGPPPNMAPRFQLGTRAVSTPIIADVLCGTTAASSTAFTPGNVSAPVMGPHPGPGGTIGPAMTFRYLAALHIARSTRKHDMPIDLDVAGCAAPPSNSLDRVPMRALPAGTDAGSIPVS